MKTYGVIMAGGGGARFWPLSRQKTPKQLLNLSGKELMVNETIDRLVYTVDKNDIFVVTNVTQVTAMKEATAGRIKPDHILSEPSARNTAACVGYAAMEVIKKYGDGVMVITPSDAYIKNVEAFTKVLNTAVGVAAKRDKLVTLGITPTFPATGYGYIKFGKSAVDLVRKVIEFKEKPDLETARNYVASGDYAWNSGIFIWKASTILKNFERFLPTIYADLLKISNAMNTDAEYDVIDAVYNKMQEISIDYGIMERSHDVLMVRGEFGWNDVGSWDMLGVIHDDAAEHGNVLIGDQINIDTTNTISYSSGKLIATIGVSNIIIVETPDAILVCGKEKAQDVKLVVNALREAGRKELL